MHGEPFGARPLVPSNSAAGGAGLLSGKSVTAALQGENQSSTTFARRNYPCACAGAYCHARLADSAELQADASPTVFFSGNVTWGSGIRARRKANEFATLDFNGETRCASERHNGAEHAGVAIVYRRSALQVVQFQAFCTLVQFLQTDRRASAPQR
jgi:hypothetical protein